MVERYGVLLCGSCFCQSARSSLPFPAMASMSADSASVTTSASSPSTTARDCLPEPPCEARISTSSPVLTRHSLAKAVLTSA